MPMLFQHGHDPELGDKVIATPDVLREDEFGPYFEARPLDGIPALVMSGLREGRYGTSYRFRVLKEQVEQTPKKSQCESRRSARADHPGGRGFEFGPVTFPADPGADIAVRSLTDAYTAPDVIRAMLRDTDTFGILWSCAPTSSAMIRRWQAPSKTHSRTPDSTQVTPTRGPAMRSPPAPPVDPPPTVAEPPTEDPPESGSLHVRENKMQTIEEVRARIDEINARFSEIQAEAGASKLDDERQAEWDAMLAERTVLDDAASDYEDRMAVLKTTVDTKPQNAVKVGQRDIVRGGTRTNVPSNIYDLGEYRNLSRSDEEMKQALRDGAMRAVDAAVFPHERSDDAKNKAHIEKLLSKDEDGVIARHILSTGNPAYSRAFGKILASKGGMLTGEEQRALATVGSSQAADGGYAVPYTLDPTIILTSDGSTNPLRGIARVETVTGNTWKGVTSAGITVSRGAEEAAITDTSPTLAQPSVTVQSVKAEIKFSIESDEDWPRLQGEMARLLQDAKDTEEADAFVNGTGLTVNPEGVVAGLASTSDVGTTGDGFDLTDLDRLITSLPDRFEPNASFLAHRAVYTEIERADRALGASPMYRSQAAGAASVLRGYARYNSSAMESDFTTSGNDILLFGDFSNFLIVDKIGLSVEIDPHVRDGDGKWTGQRALLAHYRNSSLILVDNAFRILKVGVVVS